MWLVQDREASDLSYLPMVGGQRSSGSEWHFSPLAQRRQRLCSVGCASLQCSSSTRKTRQVRWAASWSWIQNNPKRRWGRWGRKSWRREPTSASTRPLRTPGCRPLRWPPKGAQSWAERRPLPRVRSLWAEPDRHRVNALLGPPSCCL